MTSPDIPLWNLDNHPDVPVSVNPDSVPPDATAAAAPPEETLVPSPEDLVRVDEQTGRIQDEVLPPPTMEDLAIAAGEASAGGEEEEADGRDATEADASNLSSPPEQPPNGTDDRSENDTVPGPASGDQGGDGGEEPPDSVSGEGSDGGDDRDQLRRQCLDDIQTARERLADAPPNPDDARLINDALVTLAQMAPDVVTAREYANQLVNPAPQETVAMYFARHEAGDEEAFGTLRQRIEAEGAEAEAWSGLVSANLMPSDQEASAALPAADQSSAQPILDAAIQACEERKLSPRQWIDAGVKGIEDESARETAHRRLFLQHASRVIPEGGEYAESIKAEANSLADSIPDNKIVEEGPYALRAVTDIELKQQLIDRYHAEYMPTIWKLEFGDTDSAEDLLKLAPDLLKDRTVGTIALRQINLAVHSTKAALDIVDQQAAQHRSPISSEAMDTMLRQAAEWKVDYGIRIGSNVVTTVDDCTIQALQSRGRVTEDQLLARSAQQYMRRGDTTSVRFLASRSKSPEGELAILRSCWHEAKSPGQIRQLVAPRRMEMSSAEERVDVGREYHFISTMLHYNAEGMERIVRNIVTSDNYIPSSYTKTEAVSTLMAHLAETDPGKAKAFASEMVTQMLSPVYLEPTLQDLRPFHDILAKSSDPAHLSLLRTSILLSRHSEAEVLQALTKLAYNLWPGNTASEGGH